MKFSFGKYKDESLDDVVEFDRGYLEWFVNNSFNGQKQEQLQAYARKLLSEEQKYETGEDMKESKEVRVNKLASANATIKNKKLKVEVEAQNPIMADTGYISRFIDSSESLWLTAFYEKGVHNRKQFIAQNIESEFPNSVIMDLALIEGLIISVDAIMTECYIDTDYGQIAEKFKNLFSE